MKITRDFVIQNLADSGLMSADDASSLCESLSSISGPADSNTVAQELAGSSELTAYQAQCVCKGETSGLMFGDYVVLEKIGQGGMGVVLKGQHRRMERTVAIKKLTSAALESEDLVKRFYREVKASARLLHPNVVTALDAREHEGVHYLIMEFIEGEDLADVLKRQGPLPVDEAVDYVVQAAQGLEFAHKHGVFHRDIKPANLLLSAPLAPAGRGVGGEGEKRVVKILDMGLARIVSEAKGNEASRDQLTSDDQVMGTCDYMAPEQAENTKGVDHRADIYSLGCTLYRLLTNQPPYTGANLMQLLLAHRESPIPSICDVRPDVPASVDAVFQKMVAKTRDERYQSMTEVIEALQAALGRGSAPAAAPAPDPGLMDFLKQIHDEPSGVSRGGRGSGKTDAAQAAVTVQEKADPTTNETVDISATADTDPSTATRQPSTPAARPHRPAARRKRKQTPLLLLIGVGIGLSLIGVGVVAAVLYIQTDRGTVVVKTDHKDVQVLVRRGGDVHVADATNQWRIEVTSGKYSVELNEGNDRFVLDKDTITVTRGDEVRVRVELKPRPKPPRPAIAPFDTAQAKTHQKEWADYLGLPVERDFELPGGEKLTMMLIPPGEFMMGSTAEEQARFLEDPKAADEGPQHRVRISRAFYLGKYEVTQAQWEAVTGNNPSYWKGPQKPVAHGKRGMIPPFLKKLNAASAEGSRFTLPTEAQWEYACRAGTATAYFCAEDVSSIKGYGWFIVHGGGGAPHPVGQKKANGWGLHDMHGNVSEWCADRYADDYYVRSPMNDPTGPEAGKEHVVRGGNAYSPVKDLRSAKRSRHGYYAHARLGLRLACTIPYARGTKRAVPAVSSSQPPAERPTAKGPDGAPVTDFGEVTDRPPPNGLKFSGNGHVQFDTLRYAGPSPITIEAYVTPQKSGGIQPILANCQQSGLSLSNEGGLWRLYYHDSTGYQTAASDHPPKIGETVHVAGVYDGRTVRLYLDGKVQQKVGATSGKHKMSRYPLMMGADPTHGGGPESFFRGIIHQLRVSKTARYTADFQPDSELQADTDTEALYRMDNDTGDTLKDLSGHQHHGTIHKAEWYRLPISPTATGPDDESPPTGGDATAPSTASLDDLPPWQLPPGAPKPAIASFDAVQAKEHQEGWADYLKLPVERDFDLPGGETLTMRLIPPGEFLMGSTAEEQAPFLERIEAAERRWKVPLMRAEMPRHPVRITSPFYLGKYEVTQGQWQAVIGKNPSEFKDSPSHPVEHVSWDDIQPFVQKLNASFVEGKAEFTLPTEAQWEYACRAGTTTLWHGGDGEESLRESGWFTGNSVGRTHPVGQLKASAWGVHDMHGNVWEWCSDGYGAEYYGQSPMNDPSGSADGLRPVFRGGCWNHHAGYCRSAHRNNSLRRTRVNDVGFRLACKIPYPPEGEVAKPATGSSDSSTDQKLSPDAPPPATAPSDADQTDPDEQASDGGDSADSLRTWTDTSGKTVQAAFVEVKDGAVRVRLPDGKIAEVPLERLSKQDQTYVAQQAEGRR